MIFTKQDLSFLHYRWDKEDDLLHTAFNREPSRRSFDPYNGNHVLYMINHCALLIRPFGPKEVYQLESNIAHHLPAELKSERSVFNWIIRFIDQ